MIHSLTSEINAKNILSSHYQGYGVASFHAFNNQRQQSAPHYPGTPPLKPNNIIRIFVNIASKTDYLVFGFVRAKL